MPVPQNPTIKITFNGLLVSAFNQANQLYEIGVLKAKDHVLRINHITKNAAGEEHKHPEIADEIQSGDIRIEIPERNSREGVSRFYGPEGSSDPDDFRWIVDIEELHKERRPTGLPLKDGFPQQSIFVRQGLFYTAERIPVSLIRPDKTKQEVMIASPVGCNLYLNEDEKFVLSYGLGGKKLEIIAEAGTTHEITILNTPRTYPAEKSHGGKHDQANHFHFFYDLAIDVSERERFDIRRSKKQSKIFMQSRSRNEITLPSMSYAVFLAAEAKETRRSRRDFLYVASAALCVSAVNKTLASGSSLFGITVSDPSSSEASTRTLFAGGPNRPCGPILMGRRTTGLTVNAPNTLQD